MNETIEPGKWYFHVVCRSCQRGIAFMEDPSCGAGLWEPTRSQALRCPHCQTTETYQPDEVQTGPGGYRQ